MKLEHAAATDFLTNLPNRRTVTARGREMFNEAVKTHSGFAVAVIDIDFFKFLNDQYGHEAGDHALIHVGNRLRGETRTLDMIARSGGEEFTVLFSGMNAANALAAAERMRISIEKGGFRWVGQNVPITVSTGIATLRQGDQSFEDVLRRADQALYRAKSKGRNRLETA
ncbi:GGDEF domain-containing protein [Pusillimonas sp.]|uniref:GGDEF domain-containing protein n=1 Tax=Pusillimonas sp. TaxID=3040095 RepID=UPI0037C505EA